MDEASGSEGASSEEKDAAQRKDDVKEKPKKAARKRKSRKKLPPGMRRQIRTKFDTVEDLNPEAQLAQTDEIERIRRLELQQSLTALETAVLEPASLVSDDQKSDRPSGSSSSLSTASTENAGPLVVVQSDQDTSSDSNEDERSNREPAAGLPPPALPVPPPSTPPTAEKGIEAVQRKYDLLGRREDGRVLVNVGHPSNEPDIFLAPQIASVAQQHQIGGIRFLYDNIVQSVGRYRHDPGLGCILAHSMGLGKTLQVVAFIDVFLRHTTSRHVMCIVPVNTLQNWVAEFNRWLPPPPTPPATPSEEGVPSSSVKTEVGADASKGFPPNTEVRTRSFEISVLSETCRTLPSRLQVVKQWRARGGVLLIGYEMYRLLSLSVPSLGGNKMAVKRRKQLKDPAASSNTIDLDETEREMGILLEIQHGLCCPGPDLVVCDEGHRIKNDSANISQALKKIMTRCRIILTGYPLQNNLTEYWCMVDFVRPNYLGTKHEFADLFERPISNGQCIDSTPADVQLMRYRSHVLHRLLEGFVLRRGHEILKDFLPPKYEHVLMVRPSEVQVALYSFSMDQILHGSLQSASCGPLKAFAVCSKIWNHPDLLYEEALAQDQQQQEQTTKASLTTWLSEVGISNSLLYTKEASLLGKVEWPSHLIPGYQPGLLENSYKMFLAIQLLEMSVFEGDKMLIFSQSLGTLSYIEKLLTSRCLPLPRSSGKDNSVLYNNEKWVKNVNYYRIDGSTPSVERDKLINKFNSPENKQCWLFLLSTRAGCLGINLVGANRIVVMDVSWNPCYDAQAVCRVYRYGQVKPSHIYRLVCDGTMERKIYDRQISKQGMSDRVVDELQPERHFTNSDIITLLTPFTNLPPPCDYSMEAKNFYFDPLLVTVCARFGTLLTKLPFKHDSLLADSADDRMTEVEKHIALQSFQADWQARRSNHQAHPSSVGPRAPPQQFPQNMHSSHGAQATNSSAQSISMYPRRTQSTPSSSPYNGHQTYPSHHQLPPSASSPSPNPLNPQGGAGLHQNSLPVVICLDSDEEDSRDSSSTPSRCGSTPSHRGSTHSIYPLDMPTSFHADPLVGDQQWQPWQQSVTGSEQSLQWPGDSSLPLNPHHLHQSQSSPPSSAALSAPPTLGGVTTPTTLPWGYNQLSHFPSAQSPQLYHDGQQQQQQQQQLTNRLQLQASHYAQNAQVPQAQTLPQAQTRPQVQANPQTQTLPQTQTRPQVQANPHTQTLPQAQTCPQVQANPQTQTLPQVQSRHTLPQAQTRPQPLQLVQQASSYHVPASSNSSPLPPPQHRSSGASSHWSVPLTEQSNFSGHWFSSSSSTPQPPSIFLPPPPPLNTISTGTSTSSLGSQTTATPHPSRAPRQPPFHLLDLCTNETPGTREGPPNTPGGSLERPAGMAAPTSSSEPSKTFKAPSRSLAPVVKGRGTSQPRRRRAAASGGGRARTPAGAVGFGPPAAPLPSPIQSLSVLSPLAERLLKMAQTNNATATGRQQQDSISVAPSSSPMGVVNVAPANQVGMAVDSTHV